MGQAVGEAEWGRCDSGLIGLKLTYAVYVQMDVSEGNWMHESRT